MEDTVTTHRVLYGQVHNAASLGRYFSDDYSPGDLHALDVTTHSVGRRSRVFKTLNIIHVGYSQNGKSSAVNSLISAATGNMRYVARPGNGKESETTFVDGENYLSKGKVKIYDTPGFGDYDEQAFAKIKEWSSHEDSYSVLLVVVARDVTKTRLESMGNYMQQLRALKLPVMLCITKKETTGTDIFTTEYIRDALRFNEHEVVELENIRYKLMEPIPEEKRFEILQVLREIVVFAELQFARHYPELTTAARIDQTKQWVQQNITTILFTFMALAMLVMAFMIFTQPSFTPPRL